MVLIPASCTMSWTSTHSSLGTLSIRSNPLNLFVISNLKRLAHKTCLWFWYSEVPRGQIYYPRLRGEQGANLALKEPALWVPGIVSSCSPRHSKTVSLFCPGWFSENPILDLTSWPVYELEEKRKFFGLYITMENHPWHVAKWNRSSVQFSHSAVSDSVTPWIARCQTSLFITNSQSLLKLMPIESGMPSNHLILSSPSLPAFNLSQCQGLCKFISSSHQVAKVLEF